MQTCVKRAYKNEERKKEHTTNNNLQKHKEITQTTAEPTKQTQKNKK